MIRQIKRGDIFWFDFGIAKGSEQGGIRPAVVIQNDVGNKYSPTVIICPITSEIKKKEFPTHVFLHDYKKYGLGKPSQIIAEQIKTVNKSQLGDYIGSIKDEVMDEAIEISVSVGRAKSSYEPREVKSIKVKAEQIRTLDSYLVEAFFTGKQRNMKAIEELVSEREDRLKDLVRFAEGYNINYKDYYNPMIYGDLNRMVG